MKKLLWLVGWALPLGLGLNVATADVVTVNLTGHVTSVSDPSSAIMAGEPVTATYSYDTAAPVGPYLPCAAPQSIRVSVGGLTVQTEINNCLSLMNIYPGIVVAPGSGFGQFIFEMFSPAQPGGGSGPSVYLRFVDLTGQWPVSSAPPTDAPPLPLAIAEMGVRPPNSSSFMVHVDSATLAP